MEKKALVSYSRGSAFHALGLRAADDLVLRADLMRKIGEIVGARGLTQVQAAKLMRMDQPRVSALLKGKITLFSTDRLLVALSDLGQNVEVRITAARTPKGRLRLIGPGRTRFMKGRTNPKPRAALSNRAGTQKG